MAQGKSLELYFIDGDPDGMLTAEVFNWTGLVLSIPRTQIVEGLKRPEASYTGVYILIGENDDSPLAYVGEGENISNRIRNHDANKDWWSQAVLSLIWRDFLSSSLWFSQQYGLTFSRAKNARKL